MRVHLKYLSVSCLLHSTISAAWSLFLKACYVEESLRFAVIGCCIRSVKRQRIMRCRYLRYRLWHLIALVLGISIVAAILRPVPISVDYHITHISYGQRDIARIRITNTSPRSIRYWRGRLSVATYCREARAGYSLSDDMDRPVESSPDGTTISYLDHIPPGESTNIEVWLPPGCEEVAVAATLSSWRHPTWTEYWSPKLKVPKNTGE